MRILSKEEFKAKVLKDQTIAKAGKSSKMITQSSLSFKEELLHNARLAVKSTFPDAACMGEGSFMAFIDKDCYNFAVVEKKKKPSLVAANIKDPLKKVIFDKLTAHYTQEGIEEICLTKEGLILVKGRVAFAMKITKKKK